MATHKGTKGTHDKQVVIYRPRIEVGRIDLVAGDGRLVDILHEAVEMTMGGGTAVDNIAVGHTVTDAYELELYGHRFTFNVNPLDNDH